MKFMKPALKILGWTTLLLLVAVGLGAGYVWYSGQQAPAPGAIAQPVQQAPKTVVEPVKQADNAPVSASIQVFTSPIKPGANANIAIKTSPSAVCSIEVIYNNVKSKDSGLREKTADEYGTVDWSWTIEPSTPEGSWPVNVLCKKGEKSAALQQKIIVSAKADEQ